MRELVAQVGLLKIFQEVEYIDVPVTKSVCVQFKKNGDCQKYEDRIVIEKQSKPKKNKLNNDTYIVQYYADDKITIEEVITLDKLKAFADSLVIMSDKIKLK